MMKLFRDTIFSFSKSRNFFRHFAEGAKQNEALKNGKEQKKWMNTAMIEYLNSRGSNCLITELPQKMLQNRGTSECLYLVDNIAAEKFCTLIEKDIVKESSTFIAEMNPGLGLLTEQLVQTTLPKIHLYEPTSIFTSLNSRLQSIIKEHPDRLDLRKENLLRMWSATFLDFKDCGNRLLELLRGVEKKKWEDEPCMKVVGAIANNKLIKHIMMGVIFQNGFVDLGRICLYLAMQPSDWVKLTALKTATYYKPRSVMFQAFFNYEKLGELPRKSFMPWPISKPTTKRLSKNLLEFWKMDSDSLYVVKIEPKPNLHQMFHQKDMLRFFFFIRHHMHTNHMRIIPTLEKWIPHCGPRLIAKNITIYTEFMELNPEELLELYIEFSSWPEFETSQFLEFTTTFVNRIEEGVWNADSRYNDGASTSV